MEKLLYRLRKKNKRSKSELYNRYGKKLYGYAITKWKVSEDEAWELIYKTLDKVIETFDRYTFESEKKFAGFIFKIFINYLRNHYRDIKSKKPLMVPLDENIQSETENTDTYGGDESEGLNMRFLKEELHKLEDWQRILLLMRAQNYSYSEIAGYVNKPVGQLKVYHQRCKQKITKGINARLKDV